MSNMLELTQNVRGNLRAAIYAAGASESTKLLINSTDRVDPRDVPLNELQKSIINAIRKFYGQDPVLSIMGANTARDAKEFLEEAEKFRHPPEPLFAE